MPYSEHTKMSLAHGAGRIPDCLQWIDLGSGAANTLEALLLDDTHFKPEILVPNRWKGIWAMTNGHGEDGEEDLLAATMIEHCIDKLYATSLYSLKRQQDGRFLGACLPQPTGVDLHDLAYGEWCVGDLAQSLKEKNLLWHTWPEQLLFSWPLKFALVQLCEGEGETTIVGSPAFIDDFLQRSKPENYKWQSWPRM